MASQAIETDLLRLLHEEGEVADSGVLATKLGVEHQLLVGTITSLGADGLIEIKDIDHFRYALTEEGAGYLSVGTPEAQVFHAIPAEGLPLSELPAKLSSAELADIGFKNAMQQKWLGLDKSGGAPRIVRKVDKIEDKTLALLQAVSAGQEIPKADAENLQKKRRLIRPEAWKTYSLLRGPKFALERKKPATELTQEMILKGTWRDQTFKEYNFEALGQPTQGGHLHPLLKVRTQFRKIFTGMGFAEMATNNYVESSFWNFDALFQPQQHPARDAHDTFFLTRPAISTEVPQDYLERVKEVHERGGYGSAGYGYSWALAESQKNLLRTHTTAVSSRMLYKLAQDGFKPAKYFSIDRVFRNEAVDRTHLAEFHQVEGLVCDRGLTLGDLIGVLNQFFTRLGLKKLRFKPAYNPYTEPSMEIFGYSEQLGKWMELGNSGMFRPEMLRPMGMPEDVNVIAWGLSLERPTMILYGIDNIRDLFGHKVNLAMIKKNPICRLGL